MATTVSHNRKSSAVKRILSEARELAADPSTEYAAQPLEANIFEWHFTLRGPQDTEFEHGLYHGRILLPPEYPFRPPNLMVLTPNGRWELNKKICLSFTGYHEEMWQPAWGIRTALLGMQSLMAARAKAAIGIGALDYPEAERKRLALKSKDWACPTCAATCAELLGSATRPEGAAASAGGDAAKSALPEGLSVDTDAEERKAQAEADSTSAASSSSSTTTANASTSTEVTNGIPVSASTSSSLLITPSNSASSTAFSTGTPGSPDLSGATTPQRMHSESSTPHQVITAAGPVPSRRITELSRGPASGGGGGHDGPPSPHSGGGGAHGSSFRSAVGAHPSLHAPYDGHSASARMSAEILPPAGSNRRAGSSSSASQRAVASGMHRSEPAGQPAAAVAAATAPVARVEDVGQLALVDRCIAALTMLIGVLILRMIVL